MMNDNNFEYNPHKDYKTEYYESLTVLQTPYGKVFVRITTNSMTAFDYVKILFFLI